MLKARDIMTKDVITTGLSSTIEELARILVDRKISGTPVVNAKGELLGIVTENDLIRKNKRFHIPTIVRLFDAYIMLQSQSMIEEEIKAMAAVTVEDIYRKEVVTVSVFRHSDLPGQPGGAADRAAAAGGPAGGAHGDVLVAARLGRCAELAGAAGAPAVLTRPNSALNSNSS